LLFDLQGWITLLAGSLIALITLFTSCSHVDIPGSGSIQLHQQAGVLPILASLATLAGDVELATRAQLLNRCALVQLQHQHEPTPDHTRQLRTLMSFLLEYGSLA
jgi:hypothetical protein